MRLTKAIINEIIDAAVEKSDIPKRKGLLEKRKTAFAEKVRKRLVPRLVMGKIASVNSLITDINNKVDGLVFSRGVNYRAGIMLRNTATNLRQEWLFKDGLSCPIPSDASGKLTDAEIIEKDNIFRAQDEISEDEDKLRRVIASSCSGVATTKKLIELWPGVVELIPEPEKKQLPAVNVKEIEALMGRG